MPIIEVKIDPKLEFKPIEESMYSPAPDEDTGNDYQQTKITGIVQPLIKVNSTVIPFDGVVSFELRSDSFLPELTMCIDDQFNLIKTLDQPKGDNLIQIQIVPPFDNAYKKINMNFFISQIDTMGTKLYISGIYKIPELYCSRLKSYGEITTYDYITQIANDTSLGLASNLSNTEDKRYIYCNNINYVDSIDREIKFGGNESVILDSWVDYWNYINIVDIFERYNSIDSDLKLWVTKTKIMDVTTTTKNEPEQVDAKITNNPGYRNSQLYTKEYHIINNTGTNVLEGTDRVLTIYDNSTCESMETLLQDGDVSNDLFTKYNYLGEKFSEHNYLLSQECNKMYNQKISSQSIQVELSSPLLGLMRGHKVDFVWYDINDLTVPQKTEGNNIETNLPVPDEKPESGEFNINKTVSGQYLIYNTSIIYNKVGSESWKYRLTLVRPQSQINTYQPNE